MTTHHRQDSFCAGLPLILFANTHLPFCLSKRVWWCVPDSTGHKTRARSPIPEIPEPVPV
jgi:hypothetical protein